MCGFKGEPTLLQACCVKVKWFVVYLGIHLIDGFFHLRLLGEQAGSWDGVTLSVFVVSNSCLSIIF